MRILIVTPYFSPEKTGIGVAIGNSVRFFREQGHDVTVLTTFPFFPQMRVPECFRGRMWTREHCDGVVIDRSWIYVPLIDSLLHRVLHALTFTTSVLVRMLFMRTDAVICVIPFLPSAMVAAALSRAHRVPFCSFVQDLEIDAAVNLGILRGRLVISVARHLEVYVYRHSDLVLTLCTSMREQIEARGVGVEKLRIVPISVDVHGEFKRGREKAEDRNFFREHLNPVIKVVFSHFGSLAAKHSLEPLVEAARLLRDDQRLFLAIFGEGIQEKRIQKLIRHYYLSNVQLFPLTSRKNFPWVLSSCDVAILTIHPNVAQTVFPSKVISYLAAGKPIIAAVESKSEIGRLITDEGVGAVVQPGEVEALARTMNEFAQDEELRTRAGQRSLQLASARFDHEVVKRDIYEQLLLNIEQLCQNKKIV